MTNLLPLEEQERIQSMYKGRFILTGSFALIVVAFIALVLFIPSQIALTWSQAGLQQRASTESAASSSAEIKDLVRAKTLLSVLADTSLLTNPAPSTTVLKILSYKPSSVVIQHITYASHSIVLRGVAEPAQIEAFRRALALDSAFTSVKVPVGFLLGASQEFSITITGNL